MGWGETRAFLEKVVAWPVDMTGYVNLHYSMVNERGGKDIVTGKPFTKMDELISFAEWCKKKSNIKEMWYCTSLQSELGQTQAGKPKAVRLKENARALKAIWIDIDVKDDPKAYGSIEEAWNQFTAFRRDAGLPMPSAVVKSGGGLHIYWLSAKPLTPAEWAPYANGLRALLLRHGLKCDAGLTTDNVRLLRLPNTLNYKYDPPRPVELLPIPLQEYDFDEALGFLTEEAPPAVTTLPSAFAGATPIYTGPADKLSDGIERPEMPPLPLAPIVAGCAFIREAIETGGKDYSQPMWNLTTLAATFLEDGHALAHKMGRGHPDYDARSTDELWERKTRERADRNVGWPSCSAIQASGCGKCAVCPLLDAGKSPLNLGGGAGKSAEEKTARTLPHGYEIKNDAICKVEIKETKDGELIPKYHPLFYGTLDGFWVQKDATHDTLHFRTQYDKGNYKFGYITLADIAGGNITTALGKAHCKFVPENKRFLEGFFMSTLSKFHAEAEAQESYPFGWYHKNGKTTGFIYGGVVYHADGTETGAGAGDAMLSKWYAPTGELQPWLDACHTITSLKQPGLDTLIAVAFAAPLMLCTGERMVTVSAYGESATSKTGAIETGTAVWGHPVKAKGHKKTSTKSCLHQMGALRNLPMYWDEISSEVAQAHALDVIFGGTAEGGRMTTNIEQRDRGAWTTMLGTGANLCMVDFVIKEQPSHTGGINRVLEYEVFKNDPKLLGNGTDAARCITALEQNYGGMGIQYAKFLGRNFAAVDEEVKLACKQVATDLKVVQQDRLWMAAVAALLCGAKYANELGASLDLVRLKKFLYETFLANRAKRDKAGQNNADNAEEMLSAYLKARQNTQTLWTEGMTSTQGRHKNAVKFLHGPPMANSRDGIMVRWDVSTATLRISKRDFKAWVVSQKLSISPVMKGLSALYEVDDTSKRVLAAGTTYQVLPEPVIDIKVKDGSALYDVMMNYKDLKEVAVLPTAQVAKEAKA